MTINLIPFKKEELKTYLKRDEILVLLKENIEWKTKLGLTFSKNSEKDYEGSFLNEKTFRFRKILKSGRNSFIPIVTGVIVENNEITTIKLKIRFHSFVNIALLFIVLSTVIPMIYLVFNISDKSEIIKIISENIFWLFGPYIIFTMLFNHELKSLEQMMKTLLKVDSNIC